MYLSDLDAWTAVAWVVVGAWLAVMVFFLRACRQRLVLRPLGDRLEPVEFPRLSMIVAARNESDCIETCIRSLLRQDYPELEVVAVNDRSTDDTGAILDRLAIEFGGRLQVVHVKTLPAGWFGKPHAHGVPKEPPNVSQCFNAPGVREWTNFRGIRGHRRQLEFENVAHIEIACGLKRSCPPFTRRRGVI